MGAINQALAMIVPDKTKQKLQEVIKSVRDPYSKLEQHAFIEELKSDSILMAQLILQLQVLNHGL